MSQENVEIARRAMKAFNEHDVDAYQDVFVTDAEIVPLRAALEGTVYRGPDAAAQFFAAMDETWETVSGEVEELREAGDRVLLHGLLHGRGRGSGADVEMPLSLVLTFRDGRIASFRACVDHAEALVYREPASAATAATAAMAVAKPLEDRGHPPGTRERVQLIPGEVARTHRAAPNPGHCPARCPISAPLTQKPA